MNVSGLTPTGTGSVGVILPLVSGSSNYGNHDKRIAYRDAHSGWFFGQNLSADTGSYSWWNAETIQVC